MDKLIEITFYDNGKIKDYIYEGKFEKRNDNIIVTEEVYLYFCKCNREFEVQYLFNCDLEIIDNPVLLDQFIQPFKRDYSDRVLTNEEKAIKNLSSIVLNLSNEVNSIKNEIKDIKLILKGGKV